MAAGVGALMAVGVVVLHQDRFAGAAHGLAVAFGGGTVVVCMGVLLLSGAAWDVRGRVLGHLVVGLLAVIASVLVAITIFGWVRWRYLEPDVRAHYADAQGVVEQQTGLTCSAASGAMLLHRYGIRVSEGELAELAGTGLLLGTDHFLLARAMDRIVARRGLRCRNASVDYEEARRTGRPFVAGVNDPHVGHHAIFVSRMGADKVWAIDPMGGSEDAMSRSDFEERWRGDVVWLEPR